MIPLDIQTAMHYWMRYTYSYTFTLEPSIFSARRNHAQGGVYLASHVIYTCIYTYSAPTQIYREKARRGAAMFSSCKDGCRCRSSGCASSFPRGGHSAFHPPPEFLLIAVKYIGFRFPLPLSLSPFALGSVASPPPSLYPYSRRVRVIKPLEICIRSDRYRSRARGMRRRY